MGNNNQIQNRDIWVDDVKVIACILVVLGHFFQSMVKSGIIDNSSFYNWFNDTIYLFHVPLFFVCSGYLFQKYTKINNVNDYLKSMTKKLIALGIPYIVFSVCTWVLKSKFSSAVNSEVDGIIETLLNKPLSPYWYLYTLFFIFLISVSIQSKNGAITYITFAIGIKILSILGISTGLYFIDKTTANFIWFVAGMLVAYFQIEKDVKSNSIGIIITAFIFIIASIVIHIYQKYSGWLMTLLTAIACFVVVSLVQKYSSKCKRTVMNYLAKYTMPIFLMHTLFAAPLRTLLFKIGISNGIVHIVLGLLISFAGPIAAIKVMEKIKFDFLVYPMRYIKLK